MVVFELNIGITIEDHRAILRAEPLAPPAATAAAERERARRQARARDLNMQLIDRHAV